MGKTFTEVRILHIVFLTTWFAFILLPWYAGSSSVSLPGIFPAAVGFVCFSNIAIAFVLRTRYILSSAEVLRIEPQNGAALAKWRVGNLLSFVFAESVTLFGLVLKFLGAEWRIAGIFYGVGLLLLILWAPRKIEVLPQGVR